MDLCESRKGRVKSLEGKTAVVTGAAGTMGLAATRFLLEDGGRVVMADLSEARLRDVAHSRHWEIMFVEADICVAAAVASAHVRIVEKFSAVDINGSLLNGGLLME